MDKKKVKKEKTVTIGEQLNTLDDQLDDKVRQLENLLADKIEKFIVDTGVLIEEVVVDVGDNDFVPGDYELDIEVRIILNK